MPTDIAGTYLYFLLIIEVLGTTSKDFEAFWSFTLSLMVANIFKTIHIAIKEEKDQKKKMYCLILMSVPLLTREELFST